MLVPTFVDLQRFIVNKKFIVKEVAVLKQRTVLTHYIFTSPMPWKFLTRSDRHGPNKGIYTLKINRAKGVLSIVAKSAKSTAFGGKSEILGISWRKGVKVTNVLITNVIDAIEI
ncbi:hypothetical protein G5I_08016 [Acromyrmex echinatior]|uniref:Uncharacterized protein n=1 Tax=Acromyrmex echinatior TaxID=103372 RepID=F4WQD0_ACREC|nr:hypothetical protein G5I_08016 [Acromyrmex echinatior]